MKKIILATLAVGLLIAGANAADAMGHRGHGHRGHGHSHNDPFYGLQRCHTNYGWHNGHYVTTRICKTASW